MDSLNYSDYAFEEEDGKTFKLPAGKEVHDGKKKVLSCAIDIRAVVEADEDDSEGGWLIEIDCGALGKYDGFLANTAWKSTDNFLNCIRKGCRALPAIFCKLSQSDLQDYGEGLTRKFIEAATESGQAIYRKRVSRLGRQSDDITVVFGPNAVFRMGATNSYERIDISATQYVWIPNSLPELSIPDSVPPGFDVLTFLSSVMPKKTLLASCLTLGGTYGGFHYGKTMDNFQRMPSLFLHGETNCGKSLSGSMGREIFAFGAAQHFDLKSITLAGLRDIVTSQNVPIVIHDPASSEIIKAAVDDTYEMKALANYKEKKFPRTSTVVTLNADALADFRNFDNMRGMSRVVIIPFHEQLVERDAVLKIKDKDCYRYISQHAPKLFHMGDEDIAAVAGFHQSIVSDIHQKLEGYGIGQSSHRIAFNIALVYGFSRKLLELIDVAGVIAVEELRAFVLGEVCKEAATWQTKPHVKPKHTPPQTPLSPSAKQRPVGDNIHNEIIETALEKVDQDQRKNLAKIINGKSKNGTVQSFLAFKHDAVETELKSKGVDVGFLKPYSSAVRLLPGAELSRDVKFSGRSLKSSVIPTEKISKKIFELLDDTVRNVAVLADQNSNNGTVLNCDPDKADKSSNTGNGTEQSVGRCNEQTADGSMESTSAAESPACHAAESPACHAARPEEQPAKLSSAEKSDLESPGEQNHGQPIADADQDPSTSAGAVQEKELHNKDCIGTRSPARTSQSSNKESKQSSKKRKSCEERVNTREPPVTRPKRANVKVISSDDDSGISGHADLSYTEGSLQTPTPNIDKLAWDGIVLHRHYTNPICTPTRAALMTGKYSFRVGMQTAAISDGEPWGVPLQFKFFPQYVKDLGYDTWATGKWHLGQHNRASMPPARGFDQSYMLMAGDGNWFNYTTGWISPRPMSGRMLRENGKVVFSNITNNAFLPEVFTNHAEKWIRNANPDNPFFLYFATTVPHTAFEDFGAVMHTMPQYQLRPPAFSFTDKYPMRKKMLATIQVLDEQFKRITDALTYKGIINNTIIVFFADNGAPIPSSYHFVHGSNHGSNWPLRQGKGVMFEGGVRTNAFIWSPLLPKRGRITSQLFHVTDWLPTIYEACGGDVNQLGDRPGDLSGMSHWKSFYKGLNYGPRTELVNNIDTRNPQYAMIYQDFYGGLYKIIGGNIFDNSFLGWYRTPDTSDASPQTVWTPATVDCKFPAGVEITKCLPHIAPCLFELTTDPCELNNIADSYPSMLRLLRDKITAYNTTSIPAEIRPFETAADPARWDGIWVPWRDPVEIVDREPLTFMPFNPSSSY